MHIYIYIYCCGFKEGMKHISIDKFMKIFEFLKIYFECFLK